MKGFAVVMLVVACGTMGLGRTALGADSPIYDRWVPEVGLSYFSFDPDLPRDLVNHETHPDDKPFLFGGAGSTPLDQVDASFLDLSLSRYFAITESGMTAIFLHMLIPLTPVTNPAMFGHGTARLSENFA